jgi:hypothetical protein
MSLEITLANAVDSLPIEDPTAYETIAAAAKGSFRPFEDEPGVDVAVRLGHRRRGDRLVPYADVTIGLVHEGRVFRTKTIRIEGSREFRTDEPFWRVFGSIDDRPIPRDFRGWNDAFTQICREVKEARKTPRETIIGR